MQHLLAMVLAVFLLIFSKESKADLCLWNSETVAKKAQDILLKSKHFIDDPNLENRKKNFLDTIAKVEVKAVEKGKFFEVHLNNNPIDLASLYIEQGQQFINLGILSGCELSMGIRSYKKRQLIDPNPNKPKKI